MADSDEPVELGAFILRERLAGGGMGEIYRAEHVETGQPAALKVPFVDEEAERDGAQAEFRREVQALARLSHPNIASIYDYGAVPDGVRAFFGTQLPAEGIWIAMEFVDGVVSSKRAIDGGWPTFRDRLLSLLDGLAHAHAHGVLHRDLKPTNVLIDSHGAMRIVDFGVAAVLESEQNLLESESSSVRGTPKYMAPEQIQGEPENQGPWTDLYAFGCLVWRLVCGKAPFQGGARAILRSHLHSIPFDFTPLIRVPAAFQDWLEQLLKKQPSERPQRAADVAWQLEQLSRDEGGHVTGVGDGLSRPSDVATGPTLQFERRVGDQTSAATEESSASRAETIEQIGLEFEPPETSGAASRSNTRMGTSRAQQRTPPIPVDWRRDPGRRVRPLSRAGLELFGLRRIPVADRTEERNVLWSALRRVDAMGEPNAVLLTGPVGTGKSKLAEWLLRRAEELGAGIGLKVPINRSNRAADGVGRAIAGHLGLLGLAPQNAIERGTERLAELGIPADTARYDARGIVELAGLITSSDEELGGFNDLHETFAALRRILRKLAETRPVVLWVDDIPRTDRQIDFVTSLFQPNIGDDVPLVLVMTAADASLREHPNLRDQLERLVADPRGVEVAVRPLGDDEQREVIERMLNFQEGVVDRLVTRSRGRPLVAVQIVSQWVERGLVEVGESGYTLSQPVDEALPGSLSELWVERVEEVVGRFPRASRQQVRRAIEIGAIFGVRVVEKVWRTACGLRGIFADGGWISEFVEAGLAERTEDGWVFEHRLLPDAIRHQGRQQEHLSKDHAAVARAIAREYISTPSIDKEDAVGHWMQAGDYKRAFDLAYEVFDRLNRSRQSDMLDVLDQALQRVGVDEEPASHRRAQFLLCRARVASSDGRLNESEEAVEKVVDLAREHGWVRLRGDANLAAAWTAYRRSVAEPTLKSLERAEAAYAELGDVHQLGKVLKHRGTVRQRLEQDYKKSERDLRRARDLLAHAGADRDVLLCDYERCIREIQCSQLDTAEDLAHEIFERATQWRDRQVRSSALNALGEIARFQGDYEKARDFYAQALRENEARGGEVGATMSRLNVATTELHLEEYEGAECQFRELLDKAEQTGFRPQRLSAALGMLVCAAVKEDRSLWDDMMQRAESSLDEDDFRYEDHAELAELAAARADAAGWQDRRARAFELAEQFWSDVGKQDEAKRVREQRRAISGG